MPMLGDFKVTPSGTLAYHIPIDVVPAILQPHIAISYSSAYAGSGGSVLGSGWALAGIPSVHLCSLNKRQDNNWANITINLGKVDYAVNRFCLAGSRLSVIEGTYGEAGSKYQHELLDKSIITTSGTCGNSPCSFTVKKSDGSVSVYGADSSSIVRLDNKDILSWAISSRTDRFGNKIEYKYLAPGKNNILYVDDIRYGFNAAGDKYRKLSFQYTTRNSSNHQNKRIGLGGYSHIPGKVLNKILTFDHDDTQVFEYDFTTTYDNVINDYYLVKVEKSSADGSVTSFDHTFKYASNAITEPSFTKMNTIQLGSGTSDKASTKIMIMDKYGDGYNGIGLITSINNKAIFTFARGDKDGNLSIATDKMDLGDYSPNNKNEDSYDFLSFDKNGNGFNDLIKIYKGVDGKAYAQAYLTQPGKENFIEESKSQLLSQNYIDSGKGRAKYQGYDINGDGLTDIVELTPSSENPGATYNIVVYYSDVSGGFPTSESINQKLVGKVDLSASKPTTFLDIDADTLKDFFVIGAENSKVVATPLYNRLGKFLAPDGTVTKNIDLGDVGAWKDLPPYNFVDFNGDGLVDIIKFDYAAGQQVLGSIHLNSGKLFGDMVNAPNESDNTTIAFSITETGESQENARNLVFADINGNTRPDIMKYMGGTGDSTDDSKTYFEYYSHDGNTYSKQGQTSTFGAHTKNHIAVMGDRKLSSIVSVLQSADQFDVSVYRNNTVRHSSDLVQIDNGAGIVYNIEYGRVSPSIDYLNEPKPNYPNTLIGKVRDVVTSYSKSMDDGKSYGFTRKHNFEYGVPVYNRHDWEFAGYKTVIETLPSMDKRVDRSYYTEYPLRGRLKDITISQLSTGIPFTRSDTAYKSYVKYPDAIPKVTLVVRSNVTETTYVDGSSKTPADAYVKNKNFIYDPEWGIKLYSEVWHTGMKQRLYKCDRYIDSTSGAFIVGKRTGKLVTTNKAQCEKFVGKKIFSDPYALHADDLKLNYTKYDSLFQKVQGLAYSSVSKGFSTTQSTYDSKGRILTMKKSKDATKIDGIFPTTNNIKTTTFTWKDNGYINKVDEQGIITLYDIDSKFGVRTKITSPTGSESGIILDAFGTRVGTTRDGKPVMNITFGKDQNGDRFERRTEPLGNSNRVVTSYVNAGQNVWKNSKLINGDKQLITGQYKVNPDIGRVTNRYLHYINSADAQSIAFSYDKRWQRNKTVIGDRVTTKKIEFTPGIKSIGTYANDPSNKSSTPIMLSKTDHDFINKTKTHTYADGSSSTEYFDILGRVIKTVDGRNLISTFTYDMNMTRIGKVSPDAGTETFIWDSIGNKTGHNRSNETNVYEYDNNRRLIKTTRSDTNSSKPYVTSFIWDEVVSGFFNKGHLTSIVQDSNKLTKNYNKDGTLASKNMHIGDKDYKISYEFLSASYISKRLFPDNSSIGYSYNSSLELSGIEYKSTTGTSTKVSFSDFNMNTNPGTIGYGSNVIATMSLDKFGRTVQTELLENTKYLSRTILEWDKSNNIVSKTRDGHKTSYTYDVNNRLIAAKNDIFDKQYGYDPNDNLLKLGENTFTIDSASNRLVTGKVDNKVINFTHDSLGRLLGDGSSTYTYGDSGRLEKIKDSESKEVEVEYFYNSRLSTKNTEGTTLYFDDIEVFNGKYRKRIREYGRSILTIGYDEKVSYVLTDSLGSEIMRIDSVTGLPTSSYEYTPYGSNHPVSK